MRFPGLRRSPAEPSAEPAQRQVTRLAGQHVGGGGQFDGAGQPGRLLPRPLGAERGRLFGLLVVVGAGQAMAAVVFVLLVHAAVNRLADGARRPPTDLFGSWSDPAIAVAMVLTAVVTAGLRTLDRPIAERLAQSYVHRVRLSLFDHAARSVARDRRRRTVGVTVLRFTGDAGALRLWISRGLAALIVDGIVVVATVSALVLIAPVLGLAVAGVVALMTAVLLMVGGRLRGVVQQARRHRGRLAAHVNEKITYVEVIQSLGQVPRERRRLRRRSRRLSDAMVRQARVDGGVSGIVEFGRAGLVLAVLLVSLATRAQPATVGAALIIVHLLGRPICGLAQVQWYRQEAIVARRRITEVLAPLAPLTAPMGAPPLEPGPGRLELDDVSIDQILTGATVVAQPGRRIALTGPRGAGKSTLLALIARLLPPDAGTVRLDGQDLAQHDPDSVRRAIRLVSAEMPLLRGTVEHNLHYGHLRSEIVDAVSDLCELPALLRALPDGGQTRIGEGGHGLSLDHRHQLALARALLGEPRVLLLDDIDAQFDETMQAIIERLLAEYPATIILASRNPSLQARTEATWHLDRCRLNVTGPH